MNPWKINIKNIIEYELFKKDAKRIKLLLSDIADKNSHNSNNNIINNFIYKGKTLPYIGDSAFIANKRVVTTELKEEFHEKVDLILKQLDIADKAKRYTSFLLSKLFSLCETLKDCVYILPFGLDKYIPLHLQEAIAESNLTIDETTKLTVLEKEKDYLEVIQIYVFTNSLIKSRCL